MKQVYIYKKFERFWHWSQAALIIFLALTGFEIHGSFSLLGFEKAVSFHRIASYMLLGLITFSIFWHFTTGEWKQYIPTVSKLKEQIQYYTVGIFKNAPHPTIKTVNKKLNPLQAITYLGFKLLMAPVMILTGLLYLYYKGFDVNNVIVVSDIPLEWIAWLHTLGAWLLVAFVVVHIYMTTTGHSITSNIKAMLTGWELLEEEDEIVEKEGEETKNQQS